MKPEDLKTLMEESAAEVAKSIAEGNKDYMRRTTHIMKVTLFDKDTTDASISKTQLIADLVRQGYKINDITTKYKEIKACSKCWHRPKPTNKIGSEITLIRTTYRADEKFMEAKIESLTKDKVLYLINEETDNMVWTLNCNAMEMFKRNEIVWEQVIELHKPCRL